jgi:hypothetical protein
VLYVHHEEGNLWSITGLLHPAEMTLDTGMLSDEDAVLCLTQIEEALEISELPEIN